MGREEDSRKFEPHRPAREGRVAGLAMDATCIVLLAAIVIALVLPLWTTPTRALVVGGADTSLVTHPSFSYLHHRVHDLRELPQWNPYVCGGTPFLGNSTTPVYSPANVALYIGDPLRALVFAGALMVWLAGVFMFAFLRAIELGRHAALTGGAWYMLSAMLLGQISDPAALSGPVFLPLVVASFAFAFQRASLAWTGSAAVCWGLMAVSGGVHADLCALFALVMLAFSFAPAGGASLGGRLAMLVLGVGIGSALAGAQLVPAFGVLEGATYPARFAGTNHVSLASLTTLVAPGMIQSPSGINLWVGAIGLLFALLSVRLRSVYWVKYLWALVILVIGGLVLLRIPALQQAASRIPHFNEIGQAEATFLCVFAFAALAAIRLDWTLQKEALDVERTFGLVVALFLAVVVGGLLVLRDKDVTDMGLAERITREDWPAAILIGSAAVVAALFWMGSGAVRLLVFPLAVIELSLSVLLGLPSASQAPMELSEPLPEARSPELRMKGNAGAFLPNALMARRVADVNARDVPVPAGYRSYMEYVEYGRTGGFEREVRVTRNRHLLLTLAGLEYAWEDGWRNVGTGQVDEVPVSKARRAYFANVALVPLEKTDGERLALLESQIDERTRPVLLEQEVATGPLTAETGAIELLDDHPERVVLRTHAQAARLLVLADNWAPGWSAAVDGRDVRVHRVNFWMRGVEVPAGEHEVRFTYRSPWGDRGLLASALGAIGVLVLWMFALRRPVVQPIG